MASPAVPESVFVTNANQGIGFDLIRHIVCQPNPPQFIFAGCKNPSIEDRKTVSALVEGESESSCKVKLIPLDVTNEAEIEGALNIATFMMGDKEGINLLINNAGLIQDNTGQNLADQTRERMHDQFDVSVVAPLVVTKKCLPLLRKAYEKKHTLPMCYARAAVINLCLMFDSIPSSAVTLKSYDYRAARAAVNSVTTLMATELKAYGILAASIHPGWADSGRSKEPESATGSEEKDNIDSIWKTVKNLNQKSAGLVFNYDGLVLPW